MTNKPAKDKYVTEATFKKESDWVHKEFDKVHDEFPRVHQKFDRLALAQVKFDERLERVENTMATKDDIRVILDRFDYFTKKFSLFDQEESVQSFQLVEVQNKVKDHETRLTQLEASSVE